jgi:acetyl/propionyl-CoA carboxylase alpha subunit
VGFPGGIVKKVLVANRGEIACRVIHALREAGIASVAIASEPDRHARHVELADEAVVIGPAAATSSYLDVARVLDAAHATGADAVHPGYGFLAENAEFAGAVERAGLTFVGPRPETIALLGDKRRARELAERVNVPVVPGWTGEPDDLDGAARAADAMGWPVLVKAALGGGGKGMGVATLPRRHRRTVRPQAASRSGDGNGGRLPPPAGRPALTGRRLSQRRQSSA